MLFNSLISMNILRKMPVETKHTDHTHISMWRCKCSHSRFYLKGVNILLCRLTDTKDTNAHRYRQTYLYVYTACIAMAAGYQSYSRFKPSLTQQYWLPEIDEKKSYPKVKPKCLDFCPLAVYSMDDKPFNDIKWDAGQVKTERHLK